MSYLVLLNTISSSSLNSSFSISWSCVSKVLEESDSDWVDVQGLNCFAPLEENSHSSALSRASWIALEAAWLAASFTNDWLDAQFGLEQLRRPQPSVNWK